MKTLINFMFAAFAALVMVGCSDNDDTLKGATAKPEYYIPASSSSVTIVFTDGSTTPAPWQWGIVAEDRKVAQGKDPFQALETLYKEAASELSFRYNYETTNLVKVSGLAMPYEWQGKTYTLYPKGGMSVKGTRRVVEEKNAPYMELSETTYSLVYEDRITLASTIQEFLVDEGYVPSFQKMLWNAWHKGPATASYANGVATVQCPDSLVAHEVWDDGSNKNWLRTVSHSKNTFSVAVSGTEVDDINAVVGKSLTVSGNKASVAEFSVTVTRTSKEIVEKKIAYTYNGKTINFVDSLTACGYKLKGGQVTSKTSVRIDLVKEEGSETVSFTVPVNITEKVTLKEILRNYVHKAFHKVASVSNNVITLICDNNADMTKVFSNNSTEKKDIAYTWTFKFNYSMPSGLTADIIGHTYNFNNGTATVEGKDVTVTFASRSISDIMFEGKNYKSEAPICDAEVKTITFTSKTTATVTFNGEGSETVTATVPVNLTERPLDVDVEILRISITDSYKDQHAAQEGTYLHILGKKNGSYVVLSQKVGENAFKSNSISAADGNAIVNSGRAIAYVYNGSNYIIGTVTSESGVADKGYYLRYYTAAGQLAYSLGTGTGTHALKDGFRDAIRGTVKKANTDGSWTVTADGKTYTFRGL